MIESFFGKTHATDVANVFIKYMLSSFSEQMGGFSKEEWQKTLEFFNYRCAYTERYAETLVPEYVIACNKQQCGLHLYGNIIPVAKDACGVKEEKTIEDFFHSNPMLLQGEDEDTKKERFERIKDFQNRSGYFLKANSIKINLQGYLDETYREVLAITGDGTTPVNRDSFARLPDKSHIPFYGAKQAR